MSLRAWLLKSDYLYLRVELVGLEEPKAGAGVWRGVGDTQNNLIALDFWVRR